MSTDWTRYADAALQALSAPTDALGDGEVWDETLQRSALESGERRRAARSPRGAALATWAWLWLAALALLLPYDVALATTAWAALLAPWVLPGTLALGALAGALAVGADALLLRRFPLRTSLGLLVAAVTLLGAGLGGAVLTTLPGALVATGDAQALAPDPSVLRGALAVGALAGALPTLAPLLLFIAAQRAPMLARGAFVLTLALVLYWAWPQGRIDELALRLIALTLLAGGALAGGEALARRQRRWRQLGLDASSAPPLLRRMRRQIVVLSALLALLCFAPWPTPSPVTPIRLWASSPFQPPSEQVPPQRASETPVLTFGDPLPVQNATPLSPDQDAALLSYTLLQAPATVLAPPPLIVATLDTYQDGAWSAAPTVARPTQGAPPGLSATSTQAGSPCGDGITSAQSDPAQIMACVSLLAPARFATPDGSRFAGVEHPVYLPSLAGGAAVDGAPRFTLASGAPADARAYLSGAVVAHADASSAWIVSDYQTVPSRLGGGWSYVVSTPLQSGASGGSEDGFAQDHPPATTVWSPQVYGRLTAVPPALQGPLRAALSAWLPPAGSAEAASITPGEQVRRVLTGLRAWTLDPPSAAGDAGDAAVRAFLGAHHGSARVWVSTFTLLLRTLGLPARLVEGFTPPATALRVNEPTLLRVGDTGVWTQVALGAGWQDLWPAAANAAIPPPQQGSAGAQHGAAQATPTPTTTPPDAGGAPPEPPQSAPPTNPITTITQQAQSAAARLLNPLLIVLVLLAALSALTVLSLFIIAAASRFLERRRRLGDVATREDIKVVLLGIGRLGRLAGALPDPTASELDAQSELGRVLSDEARDALDRMNAPYRVYTYAAAPPEVVADLAFMTRGELFAAETPVRGALFALLRRQVRRHPLATARNARRLALERSLAPRAAGSAASAP
jgi:hypothetical protein